MSQKSLEERVRQLEELVSHQERMIEELNSVLIEHRQDHDATQKRLRTEIARLESRFERQANPFDPNEKPPHY